jgi:hypothetical protein
MTIDTFLSFLSPPGYLLERGSWPSSIPGIFFLLGFPPAIGWGMISVVGVLEVIIIMAFGATSPLSPQHLIPLLLTCFDVARVVSRVSPFATLFPFGDST